MSTEAGELEYDDSEALNAAAKYPERDTPDCELHVVTDKGNKADTLEAQARYVARYIDRTVREGKTLVTKGGALHPASYGDFCILLRTAKMFLRFMPTRSPSAAYRFSPRRPADSLRPPR